MFKIIKLVLLSAFCLVLLSFGCQDIAKLNNSSESTLINKSQVNKQVTSTKNCQVNIEFLKTNNRGERDPQGANYVIIFDPTSKALDFKVSLALAHNIYTKNAKGGFQREYVPKRFNEIISDQNAKLNGKSPIAAINADYIDTENKPQGLNISRGVEYSGAFKDKRSSFGISGGRPQDRKATIQIGRRREKSLNYNVVGGNGRFYKNGKFKDICNELGSYACNQETNRSLAAITSKGYVILLVNNREYNQTLYPSMFDDVLTGIAKSYCLGKVQEGMLFDGGLSTAFYFNNTIYVENLNPIGSVFLIYTTEGFK